MIPPHKYLSDTKVLIGEDARASLNENACTMQKMLNWIDERFPLTALWKAHLAEYYAPKNFNFWYYFGSLALLVLVLQIVTGIFLTMNYKPDAARRSRRSSTSCATCRGAG